MRVLEHRRNADVTRSPNNRRRGKKDTNERDVGQVLQIAVVGRRLRELLYRVDSFCTAPIGGMLWDDLPITDAK
jgi:hypothetical protein